MDRGGRDTLSNISSSDSSLERGFHASVYPTPYDQIMGDVMILVSSGNMLIILGLF